VNIVEDLLHSLTRSNQIGQQIFRSIQQYLIAVGNTSHLACSGVVHLA